MTSIKRLPGHVINQIKAGEVVERPASVVKELVENSIDAESTEISVELLDGGKQLIRVRDNGSGMDEDDLLLSLERHATSKLFEAKDLEGISTLGFRGEAIPSIASVSRFQISSRRAEADLGCEVSVTDGLFSQLKKCAMAPGTVVSVGNLFSNIPARLKFLRATSTEFSHLSEYIFSIALAYPRIHFTLTHNGREIFNFPATESLQARFSSMLNLDASEFTPVEFSRGSFSLSGFVGLPSAARAIPKYFITFVNGRLVKDRIIRAGILQAYSGLVLKGSLPSAVVFVEVDPSWIDVNASPAKTEVRFYDAAVVQDLIAIAVQNSVKARVHAESLPKNGQENPVHAVSAGVTATSHGGEKFERSVNRASEKIENAPLSKQAFSPRASSTYSGAPANSSPTISRPSYAPVSSPTSSTSVLSPVPARPISENVLFKKEMTGPFAGAKFLGQFSNCYLVLEVQQELWVVDQHAFHERILFEEFLVAHTSRLIPKQELLSPLLIPIPPGVAPVIEEHAKQIAVLGFRTEILKNGDVAVHSFPAFVNAQKGAKIFDEVLARVIALSGLNSSEVHPLMLKARNARRELETLGIHSSSLEATEVFHLLFATMACHSAVRAGEPLSEELVRRIMSRAGDVDFYAHCPHGRPVIRKFTAADVGDWFLRS